MGGSSSPNPANYISKPDNSLALAQIAMQSQLGQNALTNQSELLKLVSSIPQQAYTPDVYGPSGQLEQANKVAAINAYNSQKLEQMQNPEAAAARSELNKASYQDVTPNYWQNTMNQYGNKTGLI